jgi:microcompartment protein CcmK/EutM
MQIGRVIGDVVATRKDPAYEGTKLLLVQPLAADGSDSGRPLVAVDAVGAGAGEAVFFVRGKEASFPFHPLEVPADAGIVGIIDHWTMDEGAGRDVRPRSERVTAGKSPSAATSAEGGDA